MRLKTRFTQLQKLTLLSLSAVLLVGCAKLTSTQNPATSVVVFDSAQQLSGITHTSIGNVSGAACQVNLNDPIVTVRQAEQQIQRHAGRLGANAVLIENCEILQGTPGCVRQTVCKGQAIKFGQLQ